VILYTFSFFIDLFSLSSCLHEHHYHSCIWESCVTGHHLSLVCRLTTLGLAPSPLPFLMACVALYTFLPKPGILNMSDKITFTHEACPVPGSFYFFGGFRKGCLLIISLTVFILNFRFRHPKIAVYEVFDLFIVSSDFMRFSLSSVFIF
jgi:hypothetical protein